MDRGAARADGLGPRADLVLRAALVEVAADHALHHGGAGRQVLLEAQTSPEASFSEVTSSVGSAGSSTRWLTGASASGRSRRRRRGRRRPPPPARPGRGGRRRRPGARPGRRSGAPPRRCPVGTARTCSTARPAVASARLTAPQTASSWLTQNARVAAWRRTTLSRGASGGVLCRRHPLRSRGAWWILLRSRVLRWCHHRAPRAAARSHRRRGDGYRNSCCVGGRVQPGGHEQPPGARRERARRARAGARRHRGRGAARRLGHRYEARRAQRPQRARELGRAASAGRGAAAARAGREPPAGAAAAAGRRAGGR